jgi:hypothetical protein
MKEFFITLVSCSVIVFGFVIRLSLLFPLFIVKICGENFTLTSCRSYMNTKMTSDNLSTMHFFILRNGMVNISHPRHSKNCFIVHPPNHVRSIQEPVRIQGGACTLFVVMT